MSLATMIATTVLFGLAANTDNVTVGIGYGLKRRKIGWAGNLLIAILTTAATVAALAAGRAIGTFLPEAWTGTIGGRRLRASGIHLGRG